MAISKKNRGNRDLVFLLVGTMTAAFTQVVNFRLGSSKGSSEKTNLLFQDFSMGRKIEEKEKKKFIKKNFNIKWTIRYGSFYTVSMFQFRFK